MNPTIAPAGEQLADRHFASIAGLIQTRVGIQLPATKRTMVEGRLRKRARALGLADVEAYGHHLFTSDNLEAEMVHLIDCVTTNKTDFFREPAHFDFLVEHVVPRFVASGERRPLKIWSSACSTGVEAYTIAMVLAEQQRSGPRFRYSILGTDISTDVLACARAAVYPVAMLDPVPPALRQRYVMTSRNPGEGSVRIVPELRRTTQFHRLNLMDATFPFDRDVDVIFCRNVLIYFDKPTQKAVIAKLASHLRPGGILILGHAESMACGGDCGLRQVVPTIFQA